ncbi:MAG: alkylmercury lyase family protein [Gaiellaceae bacterium]
MTAVAEALAAAGIPEARVGRSRSERLSDQERALYFSILRSFARGQTPAPATIAAETRRLGLDLAAARAKLAAEDLVHFDADGAVLVAYPFSGRPTAHQVTLNGHSVYAMCAIDALGMAPMLSQPVAISSRDPASDEAVFVELSPDGAAEWQPEEAVVVVGRCCDGAAYQGCCHVLNFFASPASAERYLREHDEVSGQVITLPEAIAVGRSVFSDVFSER